MQAMTRLHDAPSPAPRSALQPVRRGRLPRGLRIALQAALFAALPALAGAGTQVRVTTSLGAFTIELEDERAPLTVANFLGYVREGQYTGTIFHRVIPSFVIQGGGLTPDLASKKTREPIPNEAGNGLANLRGTVGLARTAAPHSGDAQFYVNIADNADLNPLPTRWGYAVFGRIVDGMDVVDRIGVVPTGPMGPLKSDVPQRTVLIEKAEVLGEAAAATAPAARRQRQRRQRQRPPTRPAPARRRPPRARPRHPALRQGARPRQPTGSAERGRSRALAQLFASDLHLDAASPQAVDTFLRLLAGEARDAEALYLLGDLFESWIGDDDPDPVRTRVCGALRALTESGVAVFVLHGNRDFLLGAGFEARSGCRLLPDPVITELYGRRVLLTHGDLLCTGDAAYQELRSTVRGAFFQRRVAALSLAQRELLADEARAGSRAHTSTVHADIMDVDPDAVAALARATGVDCIIHGHTHRPAVHETRLDGRPLQRIVLDAWYERGGMLRWDADGVEAVPLPFAR
jgi:UDP-2,3-diacylglucosamine hydrolase